jgi:hypothetical protein
MASGSCFAVWWVPCVAGRHITPGKLSSPVNLACAETNLLLLMLLQVMHSHDDTEHGAVAAPHRA